jgi:uncharacterized protein YkwD
MQHSIFTCSRLFGALVLILALMGAILPPATSSAATPPNDTTPADTSTTYIPLAVASPAPPVPACTSENRDYELRVLAQINVERQRNGLPALLEHSALTLAACRHSRDMAGNHFLSHTGSDGSLPGERVSAAGYPGSYVGEVVAGDGGGSPENRVTSWMGSPKHRAIILSASAAELGVGFATTTPTAQAPWTAYWTVDFGSA